MPTIALSPRPAASAIGKLANKPMPMVSTPATRAVIAATLAVSGVVPPPM